MVGAEEGRGDVERVGEVLLVLTPKCGHVKVGKARQGKGKGRRRTLWKFVQNECACWFMAVRYGRQVQHLPTLRLHGSRGLGMPQLHPLTL
jgi:hypothetical protein